MIQAAPVPGPLLSVQDLTVEFPGRHGSVAVVRQVGLEIGAGEVVGLVGESGSGKTLTALAILRLVPPPGRIGAGRVLLDGVDLLQLSSADLRKVRGRRIGMVFQEPMTALNPVFTVGFQIGEAVRTHRRVSRARVRREAQRLLETVAIPDAASRLSDYPHQLSGGQRQRAMIAMALAARPSLLLADEPTSALDVTVQAQILELLEDLRRELGLAVLLITHDLAVVAETCDRVLVMYSGELVEKAPVKTLFSGPAHPYTRALLLALPRLGRPGPRGRLSSIPGQVPDPVRRPPGCPFHPRCADAMADCSGQEPPWYGIGEGHAARCFLHRGSNRGRAD